MGQFLPGRLPEQEQDTWVSNNVIITNIDQHLTQSSATAEIALVELDKTTQNNGHLRRSRSFKVIDFGATRKPVCDFLLVNNTMLIVECVGETLGAVMLEKKNADGADLGNAQLYTPCDLPIQKLLIEYDCFRTKIHVFFQ